jgi:precorrin isomerase
MGYEVLKAEIDGDPLGRGYAGMTDEQVAVDMNDVNTGRTRSVTMTTHEIYEAIDNTEWSGLTADQKADIRDIFALDEVDPYGRAQSVVIAIFGNPSDTLTALQAARPTNKISRAQELGLGRVRPGHVGKARAS